MIFRDRVEAGRRLAQRLAPDLQGQQVVVLGLPRGGVPVAFEVARLLGAPLDVIVVRKLGVPYQPELAMGAVGEGGVLVTNDQVLRTTGVGPEELAAVEARERREVDRRAVRFRSGRSAVPLAGKVAVIVDDGVATGATARAACQVARAQGASRVVLAVPVAAADSARALRQEADEVVCVQEPERLFAVGEWYQDFAQTSDEEVNRLLHEAAGGGGFDEDVTVRTERVSLPGHLTVPAGAQGVVVFVHGSGSSRHSPRNRAVARALNDAGLATLLFDLLTAEEEVDRANVFDIGLLASRLADAVRWAHAQPGLQGLRLGCFGASTGAAAALWAAAEPGVEVSAVVSRGGRPDLARARLPLVSVPTLLIVGGHDDVVLELNREAAAALSCEHRLAVVPGATHLFEEPGALEQVAHLAADWFMAHLAHVVRLPSG
jgi:putative phosphoribosyl transferase